MEIASFARLGYEGEIIKVEADLRRGIPAIDIVGLPDGAVKEARERMRAAIRNSGLDFPKERILINLCPADLKKEGSSFDLPIALAVLASAEQADTSESSNTVMVLGELELSGRVRPVRGVLAAISRGIACGIKLFIVPEQNLAEAQLLHQGKVEGARTLVEAVEKYHQLCATQSMTETDTNEHINTKHPNEIIRWSKIQGGYEDVKGQEKLVRALEIAAAGGHHLIAYGPPGCGKTLSLSRFPSLLPNLDTGTAMTLTRIHSIAGILPPPAFDGSNPLLYKAPFREPHQNASLEGIIGGGKNCLPGEISLAHGGVLFLDEAAQFRSSVLQALRTPLETGTVTVSRAGRADTYPAQFQLLMAVNPCPCGNFGAAGRICTCTPDMVEKYWKRMTAPLLDRIDIRVALDSPEGKSLIQSQSGFNTTDLRKSIMKARLAQQKRGKVNARLDPEEIEKICHLSPSSQTLFSKSMEHARLSGRGGHALLKVARTIADLEEEPNIQDEHILEAIQFRKWNGFVPDFLST
ncbi:MAG TPA: YifB family Mg chelatase-like AAA ATPase [Treponemataceae bacterium]|nr:YifB family Mg chelatase-like AAA ATPase [Treponemataceae bacterium]